MKIIKKQSGSKKCFVCGVDNPVGLKLKFFETDTDELTSTFNLPESYQGYTNRIHSGIITSILDETILRAIKILEDDTNGVTMEIKVNFRRPVPVNTELTVLGRITSNSKLIFEGTSEIFEGDNVLALAEGKYMKVPEEEFTGIDTNNKWIKTEVNSNVIRDYKNK